jgi:hypothetical protein
MLDAFLLLALDNAIHETEQGIGYEIVKNPYDRRQRPKMEGMGR